MSDEIELGVGWLGERRKMGCEGGMNKIGIKRGGEDGMIMVMMRMMMIWGYGDMGRCIFGLSGLVLLLTA